MSSHGQDYINAAAVNKFTGFKVKTQTKNSHGILEKYDQ